MAGPKQGDTAQPPDPRNVGTIDEFVKCLADTRVWVGKPSYGKLAERVTKLRRSRTAAVSGEQVKPTSRSTVHHLFTTFGRETLDYDLVFDLLAVMIQQREHLGLWRAAWTKVFTTRDPAMRVGVDDNLPVDLTDFVGRSVEVDRVIRLASTTERAPAAVAVIEGIAGIGKTQLAVHVAHELRRRGHFVDGQIYVNLRGYDTEGRPPVDPAAVQEEIVRALGVREHLTPDPDGRTRSYRNLLAGMKLLIILDNAASADQVRNLLPGSSTTMVFITSRKPLLGLTGVHTVTLDLFSEDEAVGFLGRAIDRKPETNDRQDMVRLARLCRRLPLALTVAAAYLRRRRTVSIADYVEHREELGLHDEVQTSLALSYQALSEDQQRVFRLLGLHPGSDLDAHAAAALADLDLSTARRELAVLVDERLLEEREVSDFRQLHDVVGAYARALAQKRDVPRERREALTRLFDLYRAIAAQAMNILVPHEATRRPQVPTPVTPMTTFDTEESARVWLDRHRPNLVAVCTHAAGRDCPRHAIDIAQLLFRYFVIGGHHTDAYTVHTAAVRSARNENDREAEGTALVNLGVSLWLRGQNEEAIHHLQDALTIFVERRDRINAGRTHNNLGLVHQWQGRQNEAHDHHQLALIEFRAVGYDSGTSDALGNLAIVYWNWGRYEESLRCFREDLAISRRVGNRDGIAISIGNMGNVYHRLGQYERALSRHTYALRIYESRRNRAGQASALTNLGAAYERLGEFSTALDYHQQAHELFVQLGDEDHVAETHAAIVLNLLWTGERDAAAEQLDAALSKYRAEDEFEPEILNRFAEALRVIGRGEQAMKWHNAALHRALVSGDDYQTARARDGIAHLHHDAGDRREARRQWHLASDLFTKVGVPESEQVRVRLAHL